MNLYYKKALIIGASSGVGRALGVELGKLGCSVTLAARDERDLTAIAQHVQLTSDVQAKPLLLDLEKSQDLNYQDFDAVFVTAGLSVSEDDINSLKPEQVNLLFQRLVNINMSGPSQILLQSFLSFKPRAAKTYIGVCSTIAAPVPRSRNLIYAAAKNGLESMVRSLQHAAAGSGVTVQFFRLGYVDSSLSYGQKLLFPALSPEQVARKMIETSLKPTKRMVYAPFYWRFIILALKALPWAMYTKLRF